MATRLFLAATVLTATILIVAGIGLSALNARLAESHFDDTLELYAKALVTYVASGSEEEHQPTPFLGPQFELSFSGWYWQITRIDKNEIRTSKSLFGSQLGTLSAQTQRLDNTTRGYEPGPGDKLLRVLERGVEGDEGSYRIAVAANADVIRAQTTQFETALFLTFLMLAIALTSSTILTVRFGLNPLRRLQDRLIAIRRGEADRINEPFPPDLAPLAAELDLLLDANREVVYRARTQVGNLAHALKTPLSVILNEANANSPRLAEKVCEQAEIMRQQTTFYLDRARAATRATSSASAADFTTTLEGLLRTFKKLYSERELIFETHIAEGLRFRGEPQDLADIIGNLLDNAGKWAKSHIRIIAAHENTHNPSERHYFCVTIEDDGPGLDPQARATALERGRRLDESRPGSGLGLSIVADLVTNYRGQLELGESEWGGVKAFLKLPHF